MYFLITSVNALLLDKMKRLCLFITKVKWNQINLKISLCHQLNVSSFTENKKIIVMQNKVDCALKIFSFAGAYPEIFRGGGFDFFCKDGKI